MQKLFIVLFVALSLSGCDQQSRDTVEKIHQQIVMLQFSLRRGQIPGSERQRLEEELSVLYTRETVEQEILKKQGTPHKGPSLEDRKDLANRQVPC